MTIEQVVNTEINSVSPTQSPKRKKRIIILEQHTSAELSLQESAEIRKIFLTPFLHYQALIAAENVSTKLSVEKIRELKKIACPAEELHLPFKNRSDAMDTITGRYNALKTALQSFADSPQSAERQLFVEVQKIYSSFVQSCIAHDEKVAKERQIAKERSIALENAAIEERNRQEEAQHLAEAKMALEQVIAHRKRLLIEKLEQLKFSVNNNSVYQQLYAFINGLTHLQQRLFSELAADLPTDVNALSRIINTLIDARREYIHQELRELEQIETNSDQQSFTIIYSNTLKIQGKPVIADFDFAKNMNDLSLKFSTLKPMLMQKIVEINRTIGSGIESANQHANEIKTLYQNKQQDRHVLMDASYRRLSKLLSNTKVQIIKQTIDGASLTDSQLDEKAANIAKRWWDSIPLINILPPIKKAYIARKASIRLEFAELKRNKILHDAYASIVASIPQVINREQNMVNFVKITNAMRNIEQTRLVILPNEKDDLLKLETETLTLQKQMQHFQELSSLVSQLQFSREPTIKFSLNTSN